MNGPKYLYIQIYNQLVEEIIKGQYGPREKLPTEKELSQQYGVSRITSQKVMLKMVEDGIAVRKAGLGSFVVDELPDVKVEQVVVESDEKPILGLVVETLWQSFGMDLFDAAYDRAKELGYNLVLKKSYGNQSEEIKAIEELIQMGANGIAIMPVHGSYYNELIVKLTVDKYPIVFVDRYLNGISAPFIGSDNLSGSKEAVKYLVKKGHIHMGLITSDDTTITSLVERKQGYIEQCIEESILIKIHDSAKGIVPESFNKEEIAETLVGIEKFLIENPNITGIVATEHFLANLCMKAACNLGKRIPEDLAVVGFDAPSDYLDDYELTHIKQNESEIGSKAIELLHDAKQHTQEKILLSATLVEGRSTRCK